MDGGNARAHQIGDWTFLPESNELVRGEDRVRLEHRNAALLDYLCARRGQVVSREALIAHVWGARHVSANSLPTAMHAIRRALGDDARAPRYLQTVAKSGYRLIATEAVVEAPPIALATRTQGMRKFFAAAAATAALALLVVGGVSLARAAATPPPTTLILTELPNQTGDARYDTTARASESVLVQALSQQRGYRVRRSAEGAGANDIRLDTKLVLWSGLPDVVLEARDVRTDTVIFSGFAFGPESSLPAKINQLAENFARRHAR